ncbi:hypothetical protein [Frankia sp. AgB32]|uniref:hypothetical protein n=1 Tax=Frankia sp. AgB32 TaxID=631119 RepID=UPI00200DDF10|nr:hypothetical protein [Frankia sp. AgB32]MCK9895296.1 hypothetical protein [Frankia sp. AgB32]
MSTIINTDPKDLEEFANLVVGFGETVTEQLRGLQTRFDQLHWQDIQKEKFRDLVTEHAQHLHSLLEAVVQVAPELRGKSAKLHEYLDGGPGL